MRLHLLFLCCLISVVRCARILGLFPVGGTSHYVAGYTLMKILAEKGHEITMVSPFDDKKAPKNIRNVTIDMGPPEEQKVDFYSFNVHHYLQTFIYHSFGIPMVNLTFSDPKVKEILKEKFDLIISEQFYTDGLRYAAVHCKAPLILFSALDASSWTNPSVGNPAPPSYVPDLLVPYSGEMTFFQRMDNSILYVINEFIRNYISLPQHDKIVKENFPGAPDISEYYNIPSLIFLNADSSVNSPIPKVPSMIDIGGFHIKTPKALPKDLQEVLDNAPHGVVYFSMGSNIKSKDMPKETLAALLRVFSELKETVLWKWEDDKLPGKPDNVVIRKWLPQNDIFAHKNIKLFITHGGIFSTLEAVYHGIPCLALPVFGDQTLNAKRSTANGFAEWIKFAEITEEKLRKALQDLLGNPKYAENAKKRSRIMHDKPLTPAETLTFWVEYVIRHKGADHLRVAAVKLSWYQYLLLDVIVFIVFCLVLFIISFKYLLTRLFGYCRKSDSKMKTH